MSAFTVYLFVRAPSEDYSTSVAAQRRLQALHALREELGRLRTVRLCAVPDQADLQVEITNVFGSYDGAGVRFGLGGADDHRVMIIRLSVGDERMDFVCADGIGHESAEHQAAKRIVSWLDNIGRHLPRDPSSSLSTNC